MDAVFIILPAITVFGLLYGVYKSVFEKQVQAKETIHHLVGENVTKVANTKVNSRITAKSKTNPENNILKRKKKNEPTWNHTLEVDLEQANLMIRTEEFLLISGGVGIVILLLAMFLLGMNPAVAILVGIVSAGGPYIFIKLKKVFRFKKAAEQFPEIIDTLVNCFKTGYGFSKAIQVVADNFDDPWGTEFGKLSAEMSLGSSQEDALNSLTRRVPLPDVYLFVTAMMIQKETGGNLAELLGKLSNTCRERFKLFRKIGAISAQGKLTAGIISCIPFFIMGMMYLFLHEPVVKFLTNPVGIILMIIVGGWMCCGIFVMFKITQIEV